MNSVITSTNLKEYSEHNKDYCRIIHLENGTPIGSMFGKCVINNRIMFPVTYDLTCFRDDFGIFSDASYGMIGHRPSQVFQTALENPAPEGRYFAMGGSDNYYHWVMDFLPRLALLQLIDDSEERRIIIDRSPTAWQAESIKFFMAGLGLQNIDLFAVPSEWTCYPDCFAPFPVRWQAPAIWDVVLSHTRRLLPAGLGPKRLFVMRTNTSKRIAINQLEVAEALEARGFVCADPGSLSFGEQVALFNNVDIVVGCHGAGLTNMLFAPRGSKLIEFRGAILQPFFGNLSISRNIEYSDMECENVFNENLSIIDHNYIVSITKLSGRLDSLGIT